ncbi:hypothetical protein B0H63DRAFT_544538 [Podospora didyma]|uniref:Uncharacterized protein n=1 Tax=Podospora didyma TaxID=330526 RepID=A0AAE0NQS9_9PEZI|nr:hypothetical protein B0H63DRAFT_544538 [Podospora didyma]
MAARATTSSTSSPTNTLSAMATLSSMTSLPSTGTLGTTTTLSSIGTAVSMPTSASAMAALMSSTSKATLISTLASLGTTNVAVASMANMNTHMGGNAVSRPPADMETRRIEHEQQLNQRDGDFLYRTNSHERQPQRHGNPTYHTHEPGEHKQQLHAWNGRPIPVSSPALFPTNISTSTTTIYSTITKTRTATCTPGMKNCPADSTIIITGTTMVTSLSETPAASSMRDPPEESSGMDDSTMADDPNGVMTAYSGEASSAPIISPTSSSSIPSPKPGSSGRTTSHHQSPTTTTYMQQPQPQLQTTPKPTSAAGAHTKTATSSPLVVQAVTTGAADRVDNAKGLQLVGRWLLLLWSFNVLIMEHEEEIGFMNYDAC